MENEKGVSLVNFLLKVKYLYDNKDKSEFLFKNSECLENLLAKWCQEIQSLKGYLKFRNQERLLAIQR